MNRVRDIRDEFSRKLSQSKFVIDKSGSKTIEILSQSFIAGDTIFGEVNRDYADREVEWYNSCSLNVNDIPGKTPKIWQDVSTKEGMINSNYGYLLFSPNNGYQYDRVKEELISNPYSRRAIAIYTRPTMHMEYNTDGMSDFVCTNAVQYLIRDNKLNAIVQMRSNDAIFGYNNDLHWQKYVLDKLCADLQIDHGNIYWNAGSLHVYERHFFLVDNYSRTGIINIKKSQYANHYPESEFI